MIGADAGGAETTSQEYQLGGDAVLAASIATGLPGLGRGTAALAAGVSRRLAGRTTAREAEQLAARVARDHADDAARTTAAQQAAQAISARARSLEDAASQQMAAKVGRSLTDWRTTPTIPGRPGVSAPTGGRGTPLGSTSMDELVDPIGDGHSFPKHVVARGEFPGVADSDTLKIIVRDVIAHGDAKEIRSGVHVYWKDGVVVISNPKDKDLGTAFIPDDGYEAYS